MTSLDDLLTDERRTRMRARVLADTAAVAEPSRPSRRRMVVGALATAAALAVVAGVGVQVVSLLSPSPTGTSTHSAPVGSQPVPGNAPEGGGTPGLSGSSDTAREGGGDEEQAERVVVTTGSAHVEVDDISSAVEEIVAFVSDEDGRIDGQRQRADERAVLTVRVPAGAIPRLTGRLEELGTLGDVNISHEDETPTAVDLEARIRSLEVSTARLEAIMADAETSQDLLATERTLAERQGELESLQAQHASLERRAELASIEVTVAAGPTSQGVSPGGFTGGLRNGWNALAGTANAVLTVTGALVPWMPFVAVGAGLWWWRRRRSAPQ